MTNVANESDGLLQQGISTETASQPTDISVEDVREQIRICLALREERLQVNPHALEHYRALFREYCQQMRFREAMVCLYALRDLGESPSQTTIEEIASVTNVDLREVLQTFADDSDTEVNAEQIDFQHVLIEAIIKPVSGELPAHIELQYQDEPPTLSIEHDAEHKGMSNRFRYRITLNGEGEVVVGEPSLTEVNEITIPRPPWTYEQLRNIRNGWRRTLIADPILHPRHSSTTLVLAEYQEDAEEALSQSLDEKGSALGVMATATGKTVVAHKLAQRRREHSLRQQNDPGRTLFLVDNTIVLSEAAEKFQSQMGGELSVGQIYEGVEQMGDMTYATPSSLRSIERLQRLFEAGKIGTVILDEVHHLPAAQNAQLLKRLRGASQDRGWNTDFIGLTATEIRPDEASVLAFFDRRVGYEYSVADGWEEGYLTPLRIQEGDRDINPRGVGPILPEHDLYETYRERRYDPSRFPYLSGLYNRELEKHPLPRGLVLAPNIASAIRFNNYLNNQTDIVSTCLTSQHKNEDPEWFEQSYQAWKAGKWPEGSKYEGRPVPTSAVAVDIFREGVDVPDINVLLNWADTDSIIRFMQGIGRGLRLSPYKTNLSVIDSVGLFRKVHLLKYLGGMFTRFGRNKKPRAGGRGGETDVSGYTDVEVDVDDGTMRSVQEMLGCSGDVSKIVIDFMESHHEHLCYRYGTYLNMDTREFPRFDQFIAQRCGYESVTQLNEYLEQMTTRISSGDLDAAREFRSKILPAFISVGYNPEKYEDQSTDEIKVNSTNALVFWRLHEKLTLSKNPLSEKELFRILPEFDKNKEEKTKAHFANLRHLRLGVFGFTQKEMVREFIRELPKDDLEKDEGKLRMQLVGMEKDLEEHNQELVLSWAEGERGKGADVESDAFVQGGHTGNWDANTWQDLASSLYIIHPRLKGKIGFDDFALPKKEFHDLLIKHDLLRNTPQNLREFIRRFEVLTSEYCTYLTGAPEQRTSATTKLAGFFAEEGNYSFVDPEVLTQTTIRKLISTTNDVENAQGKCKDLTEADHSIASSMSDLLKLGGIITVVSPETLEGLSLTLERQEKLNDYQLTTSSEREGVRIEPETPALTMKVREDGIGIPHCYIFDGDTSSTEVAYQQLDVVDREVYLDGMIESLSMLQNRYQGQLVFIVPNDRPESQFFTDLMQAILSRTDWNVLGHISEVEPSGSKHKMNFTFEGIDGSRLSFLDPQKLHYYQAYLNTGTANANRHLAYIYAQWEEFKRHLIPLQGEFNSKMEQFETDGQNGDAVTYLKAAVAERMGRKVVGRANRHALVGVCGRLDVEEDTNAPTEFQVLNATLFEISNAFWKKGYRKKTQDSLRGLCTELSSYLFTLTDRSGGAVPSELREEFKKFTLDVLTHIRETGNCPEEIGEVADKLKAQITQLREATVSVTKSTEEDVAKAPKALEEEVKLPPFFNEDGELLFWFGVAGKNRTMHWDPQCPNLTKAKKQESTDSDTLSWDRKKYKLCKQCKPPNFHYWDDYKRDFRKKYKDKVLKQDEDE